MAVKASTMPEKTGATSANLLRFTNDLLSGGPDRPSPNTPFFAEISSNEQGTLAQRTLFIRNALKDFCRGAGLPPGSVEAVIERNAREPLVINLKFIAFLVDLDQNWILVESVLFRDC